MCLVAARSNLSRCRKATITRRNPAILVHPVPAGFESKREHFWPPRIFQALKRLKMKRNGNRNFHFASRKIPRMGFFEVPKRSDLVRTPHYLHAYPAQKRKTSALPFGAYFASQVRCQRLYSGRFLPPDRYDLFWPYRQSRCCPSIKFTARSCAVYDTRGREKTPP